MSIEIFIVNCFLAVLLLVVNVQIGRWKQTSVIPFNYSSFGFGNISDKQFSENFFHSVVHPAIFLAVASSILQSFSLDSIAKELWLVIPMYWTIRFLIALVRDLIPFINLRLELTSFFVSLLLGEGTLFFIIQPLIDAEKTVFIDLAQFRDAFWFAAFTYVATLIWSITKHMTKGEKLYPSKTKERIVSRRYEKFSRRYSSHIESIIEKPFSFSSSCSKQHFVCLLYSIMMFEDHNRPFIIRLLEYIQKIFHMDRTYSLGIMQIQTDAFITSKKSIELAIKKIYPIYSSSEWHLKLYNSIMDYNHSEEYYKEVLAIYEILRKYLNLGEIGHQKVSVMKREQALNK